jgi:hypothetical protein
MRITIFVTAALMLASCGQTSEQSASQVAANGCPARASAAWSAGDAEFSVEGSAAGLDCAQATATIAMRDATGASVWTQVYPSNEVMTLAGAESVEDMQRRLGEWISPAGASADSTGDLPEWRAGDQTPMNDEFPFYPEEGIDRTAYEALRVRDAPMFCYAQGMESVACLAWRDNTMQLVGVQTFPG